MPAATAAAATTAGIASEHDERMNGGGDERAAGIINACGGVCDWCCMGAQACGCSVRARRLLGTAPRV